MPREPLKYLIERTTPIGTIARLHRRRQLRKKFIAWQSQGMSGAMPNYGKQQTVIDYIQQYKPEIFIETGTYKGKMVYAVMPYIKRIYSIELDRGYYEKAAARFVGYPDIQIIHGQSGDVLPEILKQIDQPCLFWLDAHYSGGKTARGPQDSPIMQEMDCILNHPKADSHIILVDDSRCFVGAEGYPEISELKNHIISQKPQWGFEVENDIIRIHLQ